METMQLIAAILCIYRNSACDWSSGDAFVAHQLITLHLKDTIV